MEGFDGASQSILPPYEADGIMILNEFHFINFKACLGGRSNNYVELLFIKVLLIIVATKGVSNLHLMRIHYLLYTGLMDVRVGISLMKLKAMLF